MKCTFLVSLSLSFSIRKMVASVLWKCFDKALKTLMKYVMGNASVLYFVLCTDA